MRLNELSDNPGAKHARKRLGRGIGSGLGKTSGKGHKGAKARKSNPKPQSFEGGQMPIYRRLPKRGFKNVNRPDYVAVNLDRLQSAIDAGKLATDGTIDSVRLIEAGVLRRSLDGVRLLARGELKTALTIEVVGASKAAVEAVEKAGGKVVILGGADTAAEPAV
ncbi:LSU ribosomal protein L15P [Arboricoccus pini]|uniref:Large ribosomal subunit protein uL15 n=1 Tax=Arboricoccus pini TaxID=1963835 RepID=A0A212QTR2_9PROT|nr:50S ribosomal protein L15 [Arboricoccus pini]SNB63019.1 LSU ribosomal protein L15P [Arboricoccus pini]